MKRTISVFGEILGPATIDNVRVAFDKLVADGVPESAHIAIGHGNVLATWDEVTAARS